MRPFESVANLPAAPSADLARAIFLQIVAGPEPGEVVVAEHHSFGVARRPTRVDDAAAHAGALLLDSRENSAILHLTPQLHYLAPVKNLEALFSAFEGDTRCLLRGTLGEEETSDDTALHQLPLVPVEEGSAQALISIAHDNLRIGLLDLLEADSGTIG
eukprot:CAMPEP_0170452338 /NCGR_PEP_ID=MMETSP0123-20130129/1270_1 /TAXON_ID=182087 /ORGANISM="Favella ehrenbergii, Strain Fehren 1" /LENGTH=158 /DNA_ID=CAMNT_0010714311 /DNA_START=1236 /DNA_END=1713 /DNA_ORIENTATION=-